MIGALDTGKKTRLPKDAPRGEDAATKAAAKLVCVRCAHAITSDDARIEIGGAHVHTRVNPGGVVYEFGCFSHADGCRMEGEPSGFFTWFAGYAWRVAFCARCGEHLGWRFTGAGEPFFALILDRLARPA